MIWNDNKHHNSASRVIRQMYCQNEIYREKFVLLIHSN